MIVPTPELWRISWASGCRNPEDEEDDVVARLGLCGPENRILDAAGDLGGAPAGARLEGCDEAGALDDSSGRVGVGQAIGVEDERIAGGELGAVVGQLRVGQYPEQGPGLPDLLDPSVRAQDQRQRVAPQR